MENALLSIMYSFFFGITSKLADLHNEHGLKSFKYADKIFGILWGLSVALSTLFYPEILELHIALLFLAIYNLKIDYPNHAIGFILAMFGMFYISQYIKSVNLTLVGLMLSFYILLDKITKCYKKILNPKRYINARFYIPPLIYSFIKSNPVPFIIIVTGIIGVCLTEKTLSKVPV